MGLDWASSVLGFAGDMFGSMFGNDATAEMQQANIDFMREQLQNKHQWEVKDLRKAGLNPILSATNGSSAASAGSPQGAVPQLGKALEALSHSALMKKQEEIVDYQNETERIKANAENATRPIETHIKSPHIRSGLPILVHYTLA